MDKNFITERIDKDLYESLGASVYSAYSEYILHISNEPMYEIGNARDNKINYFRYKVEHYLFNLAPMFPLKIQSKNVPNEIESAHHVELFYDNSYLITAHRLRSLDDFPKNNYGNNLNKKNKLDSMNNQLSFTFEDDIIENRAGFENYEYHFEICYGDDDFHGLFCFIGIREANKNKWYSIFDLKDYLVPSEVPEENITGTEIKFIQETKESNLG